MLLRYRGSEGMLAWAFHRISGVAIWAFILLHVLDIWLVGANPALNGLRIVIMDFWPATTRWHKQLWYASWILFLVIGIPVALQIMAPAFGLQPPFGTRELVQ